MIRLLSLFSGIGAFEKALDRQAIEYELVNYCEIDKYASKSYAAVHGVDESLNLGDITKVDTSKLHDIDLITYGFPCQDISVAGKQRGFEHNGETTRSGLFFEALRIIEDTHPKVAIAENVKNLVGKKFKKEFEIVLSSLEEAGYNNYWKVLNAKDYGIPQNRERVFIVSIRADIDPGTFKFPEPEELELRLKDMLESDVDEKYYLSDKIISGFRKHNDNHKEKGTGFIWKPKTEDDIANCLRANASLCPTDNSIMEPTVKQIGNCMPTATRDNPNQGRVYDKDGLSPTLNCMEGGNRQPMVLEPWVIGGFGEKKSNSGTQWYLQDRVYDNNIAVSVATAFNPNYIDRDYRIRKLTPKECWKLMGFDDEDFNKASKVNSNTQLYKQAGNSIVVNVLEKLFDEIWKTGIFDDWGDDL